MSSPCANPVSPYPGWELQIYRLSRTVTREDIDALLGSEELYIRDTAAGPVHIIHKYGLLEIHARIGGKRIDVWYNPGNGSYPAEYLDALIATRF
ncbi:MAG: hypothetical protein LUQ37_04410 [Methanoregulaceae archaeon]|jgi:hypothetical protein|nr:hypothetical protein [Methanoregulaceae archaeon]